MTVLIAIGPSALNASELSGPATYFARAVVATTTAQALAQSCPTLSLNPVAMAARTDLVLARLNEEGLDPAQPGDWQDAANAKITELQAAFVVKHGLATPDEDAVCSAGLSEIAEASEIGEYLIELPPQDSN